MPSDTPESRFLNPHVALAAAKETSLALAERRTDLKLVLGETAAAAQRHGNFTEVTGVPHRRENGAVLADQAQQDAQETNA